MTFLSFTRYETHSGEDVPVYAIGPGSYLFSGTVEQSYIPHAIAYASCIAPDSSHCEKPPSDDASATKNRQGHLPNFPVSAPYPNIVPNMYQPNMHIPYEPASAPVEERKYDPNLYSGQNVELNSGRPNGFNRNFGYWNAAQSFQSVSVLLLINLSLGLLIV